MSRRNYRVRSQVLRNSGTCQTCLEHRKTNYRSFRDRWLKSSSLVLSFWTIAPAYEKCLQIPNQEHFLEIVILSKTNRQKKGDASTRFQHFYTDFLQSQYFLSSLFPPPSKQSFPQRMICKIREDEKRKLKRKNTNKNN